MNDRAWAGQCAAAVLWPTASAIWLIAATPTIPFNARLTEWAISPAKSSV